MEMNNKLKAGGRWRSFLFFCFVCLFAACSQHTDVDEDLERQVIGFSCTTDEDGAMTRVGETTIDNMQYFRVSAIWDKGGNYVTVMDKQIVEKVVVGGDISWQYSPTLYWPGEDKLSFFAYTPAISSGMKSYSIDEESNTFTIDYTVDTDDHNMQEDFMVATALNKTAGTVSLEFSHALSFVSFEACNTDGKIYQITSIELPDLYNKGTLTGTPDSNNATSWEWSYTGSTEAYKVDFVHSPSPIINSGTYTQVGGTLAVLPQTLSGFEVQVSYEEIGDPGERNTTYTPSLYVFEMGKHYTFKVKLGGTP